jgi:membrane associated rhomboid family serine protease
MGEMDIGGLPAPYEFLTQRTPSIRSIFFPRATFKSITFFLSLIYVVMFIVLIGFNYSKKQTDLTWNCSLYQLQNKYYPKLRYGLQIWRVFTSALFHSNYAHFFLDLFALQIYGYFVEWYYGKAKYAITLVFASVFAHFLSTVAQKTSISTTPSAALFAIIGLKLFFLWEYRNYRKLIERRFFLYILLALITCINIIPVFVVNNIDYSTHLGKSEDTQEGSSQDCCWA